MCSYARGVTAVSVCIHLGREDVMTSDTTFINQTKAKIHDWKHELIELQARVTRGVEDPQQTQIFNQRIIELKSQISSAEDQLKKQTSA